ncbi:expressed unknown protein [Seminavis robusta]|uniref:EGF-like domain-containing protein n=1 Tax=Seminavis robusta TaxID=568900 RepID=A0A9N8EN26_9STRA|nr:expressed unknown protein [Seminavis robusta]|eukprot:Sro1258_g256810.1 n/a (1307) ;mRNA; r:12673-16778
MHTGTGSRASKSVSFSSSDDEDDDEDDEEAGKDSTRGNVHNRRRDSSFVQGDMSMAHSRASRHSKNRRNKRSSTVVIGEDGNVKDDMLEQHLSEDTFGFLLATPVSSAPFYMGIGVLLFQVAIYVLMVMNLLDVDQASENLFGVPANVNWPVWIAQIIAIIIAVITQDDIRTGLDMLREGYGAEMQVAFPHSNRWKFVLSVFARMLGGSLGLITNFLLIVTSSTVIDLLLNFTALAFVGQLDEAAFFLSKQGFAGETCLDHATKIRWVLVRFKQTGGEYLCGTIIVQMGDELRPEMGTFSGLYDLTNADGLIFSSRHVQYTDRAAGGTRFVYCADNGYWVLQWKSSLDGQFPTSTCQDYYARSSKTSEFDLTKVVDIQWYVRDEFKRETVLEPFFLHCFDCGHTYNADTGDHCSGRGTCSNAVCSCDQGWYGLRCEFLQPCPKLQLDARVSGSFLKNNEIALHLEGGLDILMDKSQNPPRLIEAYNKPVFAGHLLHGHHLLVFYTGRRWVSTHTGLISPSANWTQFNSKETALQELIKFFDNFHGHWTNYAVEFISEPMDIATPADAPQPIGILFYEAITKSSINQTEIQAPNEARPTEARMVCGYCNDDFNPCHFDGVCVQGTCSCAIGAHGSLCEKSPVANGRCDQNYNIPYFEFDGGDCCEATCISSHEFTCGEELNGHTNQGYPNCNLPPDRWQLLHDNHIVGDPLSLAGYAVATSQAGTLLAMGEPEQSRVRIYDKDGSIWVEREVLDGLPDSHFGISLDLSGGPVHWRNNPGFRSPLLLMIGVAKKGGPKRVDVFKCGVDVKCKKVDEIMNVHGKIGPEAYSMSNNGRVVAYGLAEPASVVVYEVSGDYYEGNRTARAVPEEISATASAVNGTSISVRLPLPSQATAAVTALKLSEHGDIMAVFLENPSRRRNVLRVYEWDGKIYQPKGGIVMETNAEVLQRQLALSDDGSTIAIGISECPSLDILLYTWDESSSTWMRRISPPLDNEVCDNDFLPWSVALSQDGLTIAASAYPNTDVVTTFRWITNGWRIEGDPLPGNLPGSHTSIALSADGSHLVVGLPYSATMEAGSIDTYSLPTTLCPAGHSHHFRLSLTTDYSPQNTLWELEDKSSGEIQLTGGPYPFIVATLVEEVCLDRQICHAFTIYNTASNAGLEAPGRYDLFLDGEDLDRESFSGHAKRIFFGSECMTCSDGTRMLRMMVRTCHQAEWKLTDESGSEVVGGSTANDHSCSGPDSVDGYFWEDTCIDVTKCFTFTATDTSNADQGSVGFDYILMYDDDVVFASNKGITSSATVTAGSCQVL